MPENRLEKPSRATFGDEFQICSTAWRQRHAFLQQDVEIGDRKRKLSRQRRSA
jgi:hypothetical protein